MYFCIIFYIWLCLILKKNLTEIKKSGTMSCRHCGIIFKKLNDSVRCIFFALRMQRYCSGVWDTSWKKHVAYIKKCICNLNFFDRKTFFPEHCVPLSNEVIQNRYGISTLLFNEKYQRSLSDDQRLPRVSALNSITHGNNRLLHEVIHLLSGSDMRFNLQQRQILKPRNKKHFYPEETALCSVPHRMSLHAEANRPSFSNDRQLFGTDTETSPQ